jgi:protease I
MSISKNKRVLIPLPSYGFDPTEAAIPWKLLSERDFDIVFATPNGVVAEADRLMVSGARLGIWKGLLKARKDAVTAYHEMIQSELFLKPLKL